MAQAREYSAVMSVVLRLRVDAAGPGCPKFLRSVPRPLASSFICEKLPGTPVLGCLDAPRFTNFYSQLGAWRVRRSEIKGEPAKQAEDIRVGGHTVAPADSEK